MSGRQVVNVTVVGATGLRETELLTFQDPYVVIKYGDQCATSRTHKDGHKDPTWYFSVVLGVERGYSDFELNIWNENVLPDTFIGRSRITFAEVLSSGYHDGEWQVWNKYEEREGRVRIIMRTRAADAVPHGEVIWPCGSSGTKGCMSSGQWLRDAGGVLKAGYNAWFAHNGIQQAQ